MTETVTDTAEEAEPTPTAQELRCDFCAAASPRVRRVALDRGYDRLQVRHAERYACPTCSEQKDRQRKRG